MSGFAPPARHPDYLGWAIAGVFLFPPTGVIALLCSLMVRRKRSLGDDDRAFRYSQFAKLLCWMSSLLGLALYIGVVFSILAAIRGYGFSLWP